MTVQITSKKSRDGKKIWYYLEWGKGTGERKATGIFTYDNQNQKIMFKKS